MKSMLVLLGIRSPSVGLATRQTKGDIIFAAVQRDRDARGLSSSSLFSDGQHDHLDSLWREAM